MKHEDWKGQTNIDSQHAHTVSLDRFVRLNLSYSMIKRPSLVGLPDVQYDEDPHWENEEDE